MPRDKQDVEFIVRYEPDREREVQALLIMLGDGKGHPRADTVTAEESAADSAREKAVEEGSDAQT